MSYGVKVHVWGEYACFTRPEMKAERVSYDVMTPSAARGILEAIHWKPAIRWIIDRIHVLKPIRFETFRRNEVGKKISMHNVDTAVKRKSTEGLSSFIETDRQQRATTLLRDVGYLIEAHFVLTSSTGTDDTGAKYLDMFNRRLGRGQCFHRPYLGTREFAANFAALEGEMPRSSMPEKQRDRDLGWMLYDIDFDCDATPQFFRAELRNGVIQVPPPGDRSIKT